MPSAVLGTDAKVDNLSDVRPVVGRDAGNKPLWIGLIMIAAAGLILFLILDANRRAGMAPATRPDASDLAIAPPSAPPVLYVPEEFQSPYPGDPDSRGFAPTGFGSGPQRPVDAGAPAIVRVVPAPQTMPRTETIRPEAVASTAPSYTTQTWQPAPVDTGTTSSPSQSPSPSSAIIVDGGVGATSGEASTASSGTTADGSAGGAAIAVRPSSVRSGARALIIPQGTLISAVLETGLDSTQPGQARAIVSADIRAPRSTRVLIPRGSRLFGSYQGELATGQNRVLVQWARLVRPDGVTIAIDSPASDRLGRAGIRGNLRTHFWQRLGTALLQSTIDVGSILAARGGGNSPILVAVPGRVSSVASDLVGAAPKPSISVKPGTQISVFVVRDLDFSAVEGLP
jgi:type IV secretion system protein VirB10